MPEQIPSLKIMSNEAFLALLNCLQGLKGLFLALCPPHCQSQHDQECQSQGASLLLPSTTMEMQRENQPGDLQTDTESQGWGSASLSICAGMDSHLSWHHSSAGDVCQP